MCIYVGLHAMRCRLALRIQICTGYVLHEQELRIPKPQQAYFSLTCALVMTIWPREVAALALQNEKAKGAHAVSTCVVGTDRSYFIEASAALLSTILRSLGRRKHYLLATLRVCIACTEDSSSSSSNNDMRLAHPRYN